MLTAGHCGNGSFVTGGGASAASLGSTWEFDRGLDAQAYLPHSVQGAVHEGPDFRYSEAGGRPIGGYERQWWA